jgi:hypothetical protein
MSEENVLDILQRWEATGLLDNLPMWEKEELSQLYDNAARLLLSKNATEKLPQFVFEKMNDVMYPIIRRLYRRVGTNLDIINLMSVLVGKIEANKTELSKEPTPEVNPVVDFCVSFADNYEDEKTSEKRFSEEEYIERVDKITTTVRNILLNKKMVSFVDRSVDDWKIKLSDGEKSDNHTRLWNQKIAMELIRTTLMDTNKGI